MLLVVTNSDIKVAPPMQVERVVQHVESLPQDSTILKQLLNITVYLLNPPVGIHQIANPGGLLTSHPSSQLLDYLKPTCTSGSTQPQSDSETSFVEVQVTKYDQLMACFKTLTPDNQLQFLSEAFCLFVLKMI